MSQLNITSHQEILHFPKGGKPTLAPNEWQVWGGSQDEGGLPDLDHGAHKVLVPFTWWRSQINSHHHDADMISKTQNGQIGVWFATDDDILKHADVIEAGKQVWPLVAAHFPIFRDGRSFSTAALLRNRFAWQGEIRAIGDVLIDQLLQGARVGFDSFALRPDQNLDVALKQFDLYTVATQNSWRDKRATLSA
ncbi:DUF934 domain-containing protein [Polynucleobacter sp. AP-RePozz3-80-G7]|uniref:DUF934 domain-containing protein n=1 Tax=Polynucleobacter sp. AP-RePozz3-80-G7 TaxID=2689105 RepID=UPI001C0B3E70|nr:DUF934 domain-containing protein [Polynucleobacter sp. AP-RePozz3-80-G7]MBU3638560.1 DUF934 domain-containing protein [Polynucleobacter sp. AP-RePozz3-80-G7]